MHVMRDTRQRDAIRRALVDAARPLSIDEILETAQNEVARLGIATVYRNLKSLQGEGQIVRVDLAGQSSRWEVTPGCHHHHFLCSTCDRMFEVHGCPDDLSNMLPGGYALEEHDILLRGQCVDCSGGSKLRHGQKRVRHSH
ncbi:MAG: transcriptional repressor [Chloroflexi bacterium]|nr:transcriptional repressor [Chloroflexota bacterium]